MQESPHQAGVLLAAASHLTHDLMQVARQRPGVDLRDAGRFAVLERGDHEVRLALPLSVQRRLARMGPRRNGVHRQCVVAALTQQVSNSPVQLSLAFRAEPRTAGAPSSLDRHAPPPCPKRFRTEYQVRLYTEGF